MKIHNVRLGFANNSSSSHSIVFLNGVSDHDVHDGNYGWGNFTLASSDAKLNYLSAIIEHNLRGEIGEHAAQLVATELTGKRLPDDHYGIDHQSTWMLPWSFDGKELSHEFISEYKSYLLRDNVVVLGGNDNSEGHPLAETATTAPLNLLPQEQHEKLIGRKDNDYWTLFSRENGSKIRFSFNEIKAPTKSLTPELVDLKITNHCPYGCEFCYQDSTKDGRHAEEKDLHDIIHMLGAWQVFEVAIGGGEPTLHPDFLPLLKYAREYNIVPNFTTKNLAWLNSPLAADILQTCGSFAYSVESSKDVNNLVKAMSPFKPTNPYWSHSKATVQYVIGIDSDPKILNDILDAAREHWVPVTLLGFKTTGRGAAFGEKKGVKWIDMLKRKMTTGNGLPRLSIDTVLVDKYYDELLAAGLSRLCMTREDGKFSMYIDAVKKTMHPSSYQLDKSHPLVMDYEFEENQAVFASY